VLGSEARSAAETSGVVLHCPGRTESTEGAYTISNVFIAYRTIDERQAERLAQALSDAGHVVWIAPWEIDIGDSVVGRVNDGLADASAVVLCLSSSGLSPWMDREWMSTLDRQLTGRGVRLLPVRLTGGESPVLLSDVKYADLAGDWDKGLGELLRALGGRT
jgi:hypothetical protein